MYAQFEEQQEAMNSIEEEKSAKETLVAKLESEKQQLERIKSDLNIRVRDFERNLNEAKKRNVDLKAKNDLQEQTIQSQQDELSIRVQVEGAL